MPSIAEATRASRGRDRRRLIAGVGLVLAGAFLVGLGAAGTVSGSAARTGLIVGGLAVLVSLWGLVFRTPLGERERSMAVAGTTIATASLVGLWVLVPIGLPQPVLPAAIGLVYASGVTVLLAAVMAGLTLPGRGSARDTTSEPIAWTRSTAERGDGRQAADGGTADDELSFPLEDD